MLIRFPTAITHTQLFFLLLVISFQMVCSVTVRDVAGEPSAELRQVYSMPEGQAESESNPHVSNEPPILFPANPLLVCSCQPGLAG